MRIELNGFTVTQLEDGRYFVTNSLGTEYIVDELDEAIQSINEIASEAFNG